MTDDSTDELTTAEQIARLQGIRNYLEDQSYPYLDLTGIYNSDPKAESPYVVQGTFIPEEIGGNVTVVDADDESGSTLAQENLNQMLNNFLPGGYKQRWGNFDLWRGAWDHDSAPGHADIGPMFEWRESFPLTELLGDVSEIDYTEISFDPDNVQIYVPLSVSVTKEDKNNPQYVWIPNKGIVWTGDPPMQVESLSSDPTTNYLWFKHIRGTFETDPTPLPESNLIDGFAFEEEREFVRCYYASLLTLYPRESQEVRSEIIRYRSETDDSTAFVASKERSQLLTLGLARDELQSRIETALSADPQLKRDLRFALLRANVWDRLFFDERALQHEFAVQPLMEHLIGIDYWQRVVEDDEMGVFALSGPSVVNETARLLPGDSSRQLRLLGHDERDVSGVFATIEDNPGVLAELLARCRNEKLVQAFAERVLVHSAEHALSTWSNDLTGSGTSFELWYDVNFQAQDQENARIAVYDPIQGGAGIAKEVHERLREGTETPPDSGIAVQGRCHTATADRVTIQLLASYPDGSLYNIYQSNRTEFNSLVDSTIDNVVGDSDAYSMDDIKSRVTNRVQTLFETRELAAFYSYVANEYTTVEADVGRIPRVVDLALHLNRHIFTDPKIKATYDRFADDSGRRDIAELGERLEELTIQCVSACPDCLETDAGLCLHSAGQQSARLNRRLLTAVFNQ
ncbi:hypothetical protein [Haloarcula marismortui]|jgi:hypothetical protein|uniref:Uncharacterized protein n=1 Tax=Haloarcula marismortui ATCC 33800 TaxID=662476 RepID=M0JLY9_9EURY|nr:hypothetical protein [Haloarcula sinaiiensis]EMA10001.1 hypothetical protein C436_18321 [Haloarcula sinaiiensis ATCC 33800]QUJ74972.1 hypothetical protein KDQ40_22910 [Haloarcula sinaiiensis ATCC 33800]